METWWANILETSSLPYPGQIVKQRCSLRVPSSDHPTDDFPTSLLVYRALLNRSSKVLTTFPKSPTIQSSSSLISSSTFIKAPEPQLYLRCIRGTPSSLIHNHLLLNRIDVSLIEIALHWSSHIFGWSSMFTQPSYQLYCFRKLWALLWFVAARPCLLQPFFTSRWRGIPYCLVDHYSGGVHAEDQVKVCPC